MKVRFPKRKGHPVRPMIVFEALRQPGFTPLWLSTGLNHSGHFLRTTIQGWLVLQLTNSSAWVGMVNGLPVVVTAPLTFFAGAIADQTDTRRLLIWTRAATALLCFLAGYLIASGAINVLQLLALATALNVAYYLAFPANQTYLVSLVGPERLLAANSLVNGFGFAFNILAPSLAGYAAAGFGIEWVFFALSLGYALAMSLLLVTPPPPRGDLPSGGGIFRKILEGFVYVRSRPGLAWVFYLAVVSILGAPFHTILPAVARDGLGLGAGGFGLIVASQGIGSLIGTLVLLTRGQIARKGLAMLSGGLIWAVGMFAIGASQELWQAILAAALMGFSPPLWMNSVQTVVITAVPARMRARMAGLFALCFQMVPVGYLLGGFLADAVGPGRAMLLLGIGAVLAHIPPLFSRQFREIG